MEFRILLIIVNSSLITYLFIKSSLIITPTFMLFVLFIQIIDIFRARKQLENKVITYLETIVYNENSENIESKKKLYSKMYTLLKEYNSISSKEITENEQYRDLMEKLLDNIKTGIIIYTEDYDVILINKEARYKLNLGFIEVFTNEIIESVQLNKFLHYNINEMILNNKTVYILTFQDIKSSIEKNELESWNTLLRTLNHEIMNSITPISSLASSSLSIVSESTDKDLVEALEIIERRSRSLISFVDKYRSISNIPIPDKKLFKLKDSFIHINQLVESMLTNFGANLSVSVSDNKLQLYADVVLFENVIINLIKNSLEASADSIEIDAFMDDSLLIISIKDNGTGFSVESHKKAFLPFYTTKNIGSGLGLSFVRQVLSLHNGYISIKEVDKGSILELSFL